MVSSTTTILTRGQIIPSFNEPITSGISDVQNNSHIKGGTMLRSRNFRFILVTLASFLIAGIAAAGPPWIAIEYPANPHDPNTRGAFLTVRTYHHGDLMSYEITGTAEGLVNGKRQSVKLEIRRLPATGTYAVRWQKPATGSWALVINT